MGKIVKHNYPSTSLDEFIADCEKAQIKLPPDVLLYRGMNMRIYGSVFYEEYDAQAPRQDTLSDFQALEQDPFPNLLLCEIIDAQGWTHTRLRYYREEKKYTIWDS